MNLSEEEKNILIETAKKSIRSEFEEVEIVQPDFEKYPDLKKNLGAFVTLKIDNQLRGCIGYLMGYKSLFETIIEAAKQAALNDTRFLPVSVDELEDIKVEISVLSPFMPIKSYDEIVIGKHGLLLDEGGRAVLLPQVATEHNLDVPQFLNALCQKAGLYGEYWKERMLNIKVFTAEVFGED